MMKIPPTWLITDFFSFVIALRTNDVKMMAIGNLAGMASSIAMMVSIGSLVELYVWAYQGTILSATSSLIGIIATIV